MIGAALLAGCRASATVAIRVRSDGSGTVAVTVTLDRAANVALAGGSGKPGLSTVPLGDLRARGWSVVERNDSGGGATLQLGKPFTGGAGLASVLAQLDGPHGAVRDVHVVRSRSLLRDRNGVSLLADLTHLDAGVTGDRALATRLRAAGIDVAALDAGLTARIKGSFDLTVRVVLPDGTHTTVRVEPGRQRTVSVASTTDHTGRRLALVAAALAALLGLTLFVVGQRNRRSRKLA